MSLNNQAKVASTSFLLFCFSLFLTAYSSRHPQIAQKGFSVLSEIQRPFQIVTQRAHDMIRGFFDGYINLVNVSEENLRLRERLDVLEASNSSLLEYKNENERLRKLLDVVEERKMQAVAATIIGYDPTNLSETVILDRGSSQGVAVDMPVIQGNNVVGQIIAVSPNTSRALLITDPSSGVDSIVQDSRVRGITTGTSKNTLCDLHYILPDDEVKMGDRIITSGMDQIFPKGLLVGIVADVDKESNAMFQRITLKPSADFSKLENVLVVTSKPKIE